MVRIWSLLFRAWVTYLSLFLLSYNIWIEGLTNVLLKDLVPVKELNWWPTEQSPVYKKKFVFSPSALLLKIIHEDARMPHCPTGPLEVWAVPRRSWYSPKPAHLFMTKPNLNAAFSSLSYLSLVTLLIPCLQNLTNHGFSFFFSDYLQVVQATSYSKKEGHGNGCQIF